MENASLNIVELEYRLLSALSSHLGSASIERNYSETKFAFVIGGEKRAVISIGIVDMVFCTNCGGEIEFPGYKQETHNKCAVLSTEQSVDD